MFRREIREKRERICLENYPKSTFSCKMRGLEAFIIENSTVGSKVMASISVLTGFAWFFGYLNCFNSNFDPRIVVGKGIL